MSATESRIAATRRFRTAPRLVISTHKSCGPWTALLVYCVWLLCAAQSFRKWRVSRFSSSCCELCPADFHPSLKACLRYAASFMRFFAEFMQKSFAVLHLVTRTKCTWNRHREKVKTRDFRGAKTLQHEIINLTLIHLSQFFLKFVVGFFRFYQIFSCCVEAFLQISNSANIL